MKAKLVILLISVSLFLGCSNSESNLKQSSAISVPMISEDTSKSDGKTIAAGDKSQMVIENLNNWKHPIKNLFKEKSIKLNKLVFMYNKTYSM